VDAAAAETGLLQARCGADHAKLGSTGPPWCAMPPGWKGLLTGELGESVLSMAHERAFQ
jgi:hypothetical protein